MLDFETSFHSGDGQATRETTLLMSDLVKRRVQGRRITFASISEQGKENYNLDGPPRCQDYLIESPCFSILGVSIYSCSKRASDEFPGLDPTVISAVSIARRLRDPISELVKVEPKHLGKDLVGPSVVNKLPE